jgi:hypothetical protein
MVFLMILGKTIWFGAPCSFSQESFLVGVEVMTTLEQMTTSQQKADLFQFSFF